MRRLLAVGGVSVLLSTGALFLLARPVPKNSDFEPVQALSVGPVTAPYQTLASGIVILTVSVSETGKVQDVKVQNAVGPLTQAAVSAVKGWTFKPAAVDGSAVASAITVAAVFNTQCLFTSPTAFTAQPEQQPGPVNGFQPAAVTSADVPACPYGTALLSANVALQASIDAAGNMTATRALQNTPPYTAAAIQSLGNNWKFTPARLEGNPVDSNVVVAFFFRQAATGGGLVR